MKQMYKLGLLAMGLFVLVNFSKAQDDLVITAIVDGDLSGGLPKAIEIYVINNVADLSAYSIAKAGNGAATFSGDYALSGSANAGEYLYIGSETTSFNAFFGFDPDFVTSTANNNGDDVVGLFHSSSLVDVYGVVGVNGDGETWDYTDGWAYRNNSTGPDATFIDSDWTYSGLGGLDGESSNASAANPVPLGTYTAGPPPSNTIVQFESASATVSEGDGTYELVLSITNEDAVATTVDVIISTDVTPTADAADIDNYTTQQVTFPSSDASNQSVTITLSDDAIVEGTEVLYFELTNVTGGNSAELGTNVIFELTIQDDDGTGVVINEVDYADSDVIELKNTTDGTVDISGYHVCSLFSYAAVSGLTVESGSLSMAPGSITVLSGFGLNNTAADLGLYTTNANFGSASNMTSFVQWGSAGNGRESVAQNRGIWTAGDFIPTVGTGNTIEFDGEGFTSSDWVEQTIPTLGAENSLIETVSDIATLRAGASDGTVYRLGGEAIITHVTGNSRDQIFIEDATGGILIDDNAPIIPASTLALGDGVTNLEGTLTSFGGVLQIIPTSVPTEITTGNTITTQTVTIADFNANVDAYESELLLLEAVTFTNANGTLTFTEPSSDYSTISDGTNTTTFDADGFLGADYTGDVIPYGRQDLIVLGRENNGTPIVTSRFAVDIQDNYAPIFTVAPSASNETIEGADITFQSDEPGSLFYLALADGADAPNAAAVLAGTAVAYTEVGADATITLTSLADNTPFDVYVLLSDGTNDQDTPVLVEFTTVEIVFDADSEANAPNTQLSSAIFSGLEDALEDAVPVFAFDVEDLGTGDTQTTTVLSVVIEPGSNNTAAWSTTLGGAILSDGANDFTGVITDNQITFDLSGTPSFVDNNDSRLYTVSVYTSGTVTDGDVLEFEIPTDHSFTASVAGSVFAATFPAAVTSAQHTIDVVATALAVEAPSTVGLNTDFSLTVSAEDANGNIDVQARSISVSSTGVGNLTSMIGKDSQAMTDGVFVWTDLQLDATGSYTLTVADDGSALTGSVMLEAVDGIAGPAQLLITEIMVTPTESEFIEIYNNTDGTVFLDDYYLTDAVSSSILYYEIVNGAGIGTDNFDFHVRFPTGSSIEPGETQTIALAGSDNFLAAFGSNPTYELQEDGAEPDAIPDMINAGNIGGSVGLSNSGEMVVLYYWDGASDLVTDIDYVVWGDKNEAFDKSGISIDGPDDGTETSTYFTETAIASQDVIATGSHAFGNSWQREDFDEGTEVKTGGNGVDGHDETSENFSATFIERTPTPGLQVFEAPTIVIDDELFDANLGNVLIGGSTTSTYTVSGVNLTGDITITSAGAYAISTDGSTFGSEVTLSPTEGIVSETTITVQFTPDVEGSIEGEIAHDTDGSGTTTIEVSGAGITETTIFFEGFGNCDALNSFTSQSVIGDEVWECEFFGETGYGVRMSGFNGGALDNEDWLVTPAINLSSVDGADLSFDTDWANDDVALEVFVSADYTGDVTTATWSSLSVLLDESSEFDTWTNSGEVVLPVGGIVYVGFKYTSNPTDGSATWTIDNVKVTETLPFFTASNFGGLFNQVDVGTSSPSQSFILDGFGLTADATVTPPAQFEVALTDAFTSIGTSASPLTITQTDGVIDGVEVFVRFSPTMEGTASGNVTVSTTGFDDITLSVEGFGEADDPVLGLKDVTINIYPNPASSSFSVVNDGNQRIDVKLYGIDGSVMTMKQSGNDYDISHLSSGMYILKLTNESGEEMTRRIIKE